MHDTRREVAGVPVRLVHSGPAPEAAARGALLFYHGLGAEIAGQTKELHGLASRGYLAVGVDAVGHGLRRWPDFEARLSGPRSRTDVVFGELVGSSLSEVPALLDALEAEGLARPGRLGVAGISMGGYIAYGAAARMDRFQVCLPILGSPSWGTPGSPAESPEAFYPVALLAQNAGADESVPPDAAREFTEVLRPHYAADPARLDYVEYPGCGHFMPEDEWERLWSRAVAWVEKWLP
jgi:alpha-beta hydrolase superfamily lysophospholipase